MDGSIPALSQHRLTNCVNISANLLAAVRLREIDNRSERHDSGGINFFVRHVVMALDVIDADGLGDSRLLIEIEQITLQIRVVDDAPKIAFEMPVINGIEANERAKGE